MVVLTSCASDLPPTDSVKAVTGAINAPGGPESYEIVDCLLPGQIRRLGTQLTYVTERRPVRTTAEDCAIRGGEYLAGDRADYGTSLKIWLAEAQKGSAEAQYYAATLYEKGAGGSPDYRQAAEWYRKAAEQGDKRAMISLGRLYEQGLGVAKDPTQAVEWLTKASGLNENALSLLENADVPNAQATARIRELEDQLQERRRLAADERRKRQDAEQRYQTARTELEQLRAKPDQSAAVIQYETTVKRLEEEMGRVKDELDARVKAVAQLQGTIDSLKAEAKKQTQDLGFDGPSLEVIDPPLVRTRGIPASKEDLTIAVHTGIRRSVTGRVLAPAGLQTLMVNGERMTPNEDGVFTTMLRALRSASDELPVQILAKDTQDKLATLKFMLRAKDAMQPSRQPLTQNIEAFGRYHALVIGNDHYAHWPELRNALSDANALAKVLERQYGFQVTLLKDANRAQIMKALNQYRKLLTEQDNLLIYYAGHGHLEQGIERGYWIPVDAEMNDNSEWVPLPAVTDLLQLISAKHVMVVADSCFSGKLTRSSLAQLKPDLADEARSDLLKTLAQEHVRTAMTSGGVKPVLDAGGSGHSVFAEALLGVLEENSIILEARRLFDAIQARVISTTERIGLKQIPTYDPIHMAGHESIGDFIFVPQTR